MNILARRRPTPDPQRNNFDVDCTCGHRWHGLKCDRLQCQCPTSWVEPT